MVRFYERGRQGLATIRRFPLPTLLSVLLFLVVILQLLSLPGIFFYGSELAALSGALACLTVWSLAAQLAKALVLGRRRVSALVYLLVPLAVLVLFWWFGGMSTPYRWLSVGGICLAGGAAGCAFVSRQYGVAAWNYLCWSALKCTAFGVLVLASSGLCVLAWHVLLFPVTVNMPLILLHGSFFVAAFWAFLTYLPRDGQTIRAVPLFGSVLWRAFFPAFVVYIGILYAYVASMVWQQELPVGQLNWFVSLALGGWVFLYLTGRPAGTTRWLAVVLRYGGLTLLPLVAVQLWCVYIRVAAYGLTPLRYAALACTVFGVLTILGALGMLRNSLLFGLAAVGIGFTFLSPWNLYALPYELHVQRVYQILESHQMLRDGAVVRGGPLPAADLERLLGSYEYLRDHQDERRGAGGQLFVTSAVLQELTLAQRQQPFIFRTRSQQPVPVAGFARIYPLEGTTEQGILTIPVANGSIQVDLVPVVQSLQNAASEGDVSEPLQVTADAEHVLYITELVRTKEAAAEPVILVRGYVLER